MRKLKRIVVGIDIVEKSDNVLKRALMIAKENQAELLIIHVVQIPWLSMPNYFNRGEISIDKNTLKKKIEKKIKALNANAKVPYLILVKEGDADDIILYESKQSRADMIILGAHSKTKDKKRFLGTTVQKIAHKSHLPVLVIKNSAKKPYQNILAPTDFEMQSKQSILFSKNIFPASTISIIYASQTIYPYVLAGPDLLAGPDPLQYAEIQKVYDEKYLREFMHDISIKKGEMIDGGMDSKEAILKYIKKGSYDLVVVGSRGTAGFNALLGSVALYILRESSCDVLVYVPVD